MKIPLIFISIFCLNLSFAQVKKLEQKEFRSSKEIEQEEVIQKLRENFKLHYLFSKNEFYLVDATATINNNPFYTFKGISKLQAITPIDCDSKYANNKQKMEAYKQSENSVFKVERAPRELIPFYVTSVFLQLENIYENYNFFSERDFSYNLLDIADQEYYHLSFLSKNPKLPISGKIVISRKNYYPKSLEYTISSDYTFEMSSDNFNYKKSVSYTARVLKELVSIDFIEKDKLFTIQKYQSEYQFKNEPKDKKIDLNGDIGYSKIQLEYYGKEPKVCKTSFDLNTLE